jgi:rhodanese-related sulfurtransferase
VIVRDPHTRRTVLFSLATLGVLAVIITIQFLNAPPSLTPRQAEGLLRNDPSTVLLDVRTDEEFHGAEGRIVGALHIPVDELEGRMTELPRGTGRTVIVYCRSGRRSRNAAALLAKNGFRTYNLEGGILAWQEASLPVAHDPEGK